MPSRADDGIAFERDVRALVGPTERDLKFHDKIDGEFVFTFRLAARVKLYDGRWWEQKPRLFGPDEGPAHFFDTWLSDRGRVAGEAWPLPEFESEALHNASNPILRLRAVQFI